MAEVEITITPKLDPALTEQDLISNPVTYIQNPILSALEVQSYNSDQVAKLEIINPNQLITTSILDLNIFFQGPQRGPSKKIRDSLINTLKTLNQGNKLQQIKALDFSTSQLEPLDVALIIAAMPRVKKIYLNNKSSITVSEFKNNLSGEAYKKEAIRPIEPNKNTLALHSITLIISEIHKIFLTLLKLPKDNIHKINLEALQERIIEIQHFLKKEPLNLKEYKEKFLAAEKACATFFRAFATELFEKIKFDKQLEKLKNLNPSAEAGEIIERLKKHKNDFLDRTIDYDKFIENCQDVLTTASNDKRLNQAPTWKKYLFTFLNALIFTFTFGCNKTCFKLTSLTVDTLETLQKDMITQKSSSVTALGSMFKTEFLKVQQEQEEPLPKSDRPKPN